MYFLVTWSGKISLYCNTVTVNLLCMCCDSPFHLVSQASIIGFHSKKVLHVGVRNRFCTVCHRNKSNNLVVPAHTCHLNWTKSATGMESDIIAEGFKRSMEIHGLKYNVMIGIFGCACHVMN